MKELLSNEEIETLMEMFRSDESDLQEETQFAGLGGFTKSAREAVVSPVDLLKPNRISREQMQDFERIFESAAKGIGATMCDRLRYDMNCDCVATEQLRFNSWMQLVGNNAAIYVLSAPPLEQPLLFSVTTNLLYGSVDRILGGHGKVSEVPSDFSEAELVVADAFLEPVFERLGASLGELTDLQLSVDSRTTNPSLAYVFPSQDVVVAAHFQTGGEFLLGDLRLALPYTAIESHLARLGTGPGKFKQLPGSMRDTLRRTVSPVEVSMSIDLGRAALSLRELLALRVGDVVTLNQRLGEPLVAPVQGHPKFTGQIGTLGRRLAFQIGSVLE
ncbi:MAG: FliM/FliN family flagellar motor switch protein [Planctomycetes bacterium]|nr:FliM/FliN family flagellar motor switch protein [Planctomycetota bacterium]MCB9872243.1 FliM/FliN family flagellar motor switch protein [Planctomycetota bacterium]MCB9888049.1 FliM/FliN family flagellar motor switch protein [Planctomycetota bacterium]